MEYIAIAINVFTITISIVFRHFELQAYNFTTTTTAAATTEKTLYTILYYEYIIKILSQLNAIN